MKILGADIMSIPGFYQFIQVLFLLILEKQVMDNLIRRNSIFFLKKIWICRSKLTAWLLICRRPSRNGLQVCTSGHEVTKYIFSILRRMFINILLFMTSRKMSRQTFFFSDNKLLEFSFNVIFPAAWPSRSLWEYYM